MNSFNAMARAIDYEIERQEKLYKEGRGDEIVQETRTWDDQNQRTVTMRKKEGLADYHTSRTGFKSHSCVRKRTSQTFERKCQSYRTKFATGTKR